MDKKTIINSLIPTIISRIGIFSISFISVTMLSNYKHIELSYFSISDTIIVLLMIITNGLTQGVLFKTSEAFGQKKI